jgi:hypothetical protein
MVKAEWITDHIHHHLLRMEIDMLVDTKNVNMTDMTWMFLNQGGKQRLNEKIHKKVQINRLHAKY